MTIQYCKLGGQKGTLLGQQQAFRREMVLKAGLAGKFAAGLEAADGGWNSKCQGEDEAGGDEVAAVEGQAGGEAGHEAGGAGGVHAAGTAGGDPDGVVGDQEEGGGSEERGGGYTQDGDFAAEEDPAEDDGCGVPAPCDEIVLPVKLVGVDVGGKVVVDGGEGGYGEEHFPPVSACAEVEQRATDGGETEPAGVGDDAAQKSG